MMKFFTNKKIWEKVILALIFVMLFQFAVMKPVEADVVEFAGKLMTPIISLFVTLGDGVMDILHSSIMGISNPLLHAEGDSPVFELFKSIIAAVVTAACVIGAIVLSGGIAVFLGVVAAFSAGSWYLTGESILVDIGETSTKAVASLFGAEMLPEELYLPAYSYSPEEIFKGNILLFNVNFFRDPVEIQEKTHEEDGKTITDYWYYIDEETGEEVRTSKQDSAEILQTTISTWYNAIRNICIVLMLSVLVYIGIRILLSTVANEKAKYLTMLRDWFVGLCLLFLMHYIMAFSVTLVQKLTDVVSDSTPEQYYHVALEGTDELKDDLEELKLTGDDAGNLDIKDDIDGDGEDEYVWTTNLMGYLRTTLQMESPGGQYIGEAICFLVLVVFTVMFTFTYLRRLLYMAFLTLIAPVVALTYCIDKTNDGSAQGFNKWFKEYIFNLLIQPMHLLLYYVLIGVAFNTLGDNFIYSIVAIGFMLPAEKLLRSLFGFEKATTPSVLGGAAATSLMMSGINGLTKIARGGASKGGKGSGNGSGDNSSDATRPMRTNDVSATNEMLNASQNEEQEARQQMLDTYNENYGSSDWDPAEAEAMNREFNNTLNSQGQQYSDEEYANILRDSGWSEEEIAQEMENNSNNIRQQPIPDLDTGENDSVRQQQVVSAPEPEQEQQRSQGRFKRKAGRFVRSAGTAVVTGAKRKLKSVPRTAKGIAMGTIMGTAVATGGVVAATAMGDPGKAGTAVATAVGAGYAFGKSSSNSKLTDNLDPEVKAAYDRVHNAPEYSDEMMDDYVKKLKKDPNVREQLRVNLGKDKAKEVLKKGGHFEQFTRNGIDDIEDIIAAEKLISDGTFNNVNHATAVIKNDQRMGRQDPNKMSKKTRDEWRDSFREDYIKAGASARKAEDTVDKTMNLVHALHKAKK